VAIFGRHRGEYVVYSLGRYFVIAVLHRLLVNSFFVLGKFRFEIALIAGKKRQAYQK